MQHVKANFFQTQSVKANVVRTTRAMASAFWRRSVFTIRMQRVVQMWSVNANGRRGLRWHATHTSAKILILIRATGASEAYGSTGSKI